MRPAALLLLFLVLLLGFGFLLFSRGREGGKGEMPLTLGLDSALGAPTSGQPAPLAEAEPAEDVGPASGRAAVLQDVPLEPRISEGPGGIDVLVLDQTGGALLGAAGSLPLDEQYWIRLFLGRGRLPAARDPLGAHEVTVIPESRRRASRKAGWVTSLEAPGGDAYVALAFGEFIVAAAAIEPGAEKVELVAGYGDFDSMYASVDGSLPGMVEASRLVRIRPERPPVSTGAGLGARSSGFPLSVAVEGVGGRFTAKRLPPGKMTVVVRAEATALGPALHAARKAKGMGALSMGARLPNREQWALRLGVLRQLQLPVADVPLDLAPGENRQLGSLSVERSAAVVLELIDTNGDPVDATSVDVMVLGGPDEPVESVLTWTFESSASLYPLRQRPTEFQVVQGDLGALVDMTPAALESDVPIATRPVRLQALSVIVLPEAGSAEPQLLTAKGNLVRVDSRWVGSRYHGHEIRGRTLAVPAGSYRIDVAGSRTSITLGPGQFVDASSGSPLPATQLEGEEVR